MNKTRKFLITFFIIAISLAFAVGAVACKEILPEDKNGSETSKAPFSNGDFISYTGQSYPMTPTNWASAPGSTSSSSGTPTGKENITAGVIDVEESSFKSNKSAYGKIDNPSAVSKVDTKILMLHNKVASSYNYTSDSIKIEKNKYYKLSVWVKTDKLSGSANDSTFGAYITVNGDAYASFSAINTENTWKEYSLFIEGSKIDSTTITIELSLGTGNKTSGHMTKGYAFFDDITLSDKNAEGVAYTAADYNAVVANNDNIAKYSTQLSDQNFEFVTDTTTMPYSPIKFTGKSGFGSGENAPSSTSYVERGIVNKTMNITDSESQTIAITDPTERVSNRMLMINNKKLTAYGYRANVPMLFENGKYYKFSIKVRTLMVEGKGITVKLSDGTDTDTLNFKYENIDTKGEWQTISILVKGNDLRSNKLYLEMWAGVGGVDDATTHFKGTAFFDDATLETIGENDFKPDTDHNYSLQVNTPKPISMNGFKQYDKEDIMNSLDRTKFDIFDIKDWDSKGFNLPNPGVVSTSASAQDILVLNNFLNNSYAVGNIFKGTSNVDISHATKLDPNTFYLISVWVKTSGIDKAKGLKVNLISYDQKDNEDITNDQYKNSVKVISSIDNFNSENVDKEELKNNNGYTALSFYVQGNQLKTKGIGLEFVLGSGKETSSSSLVMGTAFVNNISYEAITSSEYTTATDNSTNKKVALKDAAGSGEVSSNGLFNFIDVPGTESTYKDLAKEQNKKIFENGNLKDYLGLPVDWSISKKDALTDKTNSRGGVMQLNNGAGAAQSFADLGFGLNPEYPAGHKILNKKSYPNVLALKNSNNLNSFGFTSTSLSLTEGSYYVFEVWAKSAVDDNFSIELVTTSDNTLSTDSNFLGRTNTEWTKYQIYVETGISSVSVKLGLHAGNPKATVSSENEVYFTGATYSVITKEAFDKRNDEANKSENVITRSWLVDAFDDYTTVEDKLSKPNSWTANVVENDAPVDEESMIAGVFNRTRDDWNLLGINPDSQRDLIGKIFGDENNATTTNVGNSIFALYNKEKTAYKYASKTTSLKAEKYYKISIWALTYGLGKDESAFITLKMNNKTYTFGLFNASTENAKARKINTSTYAEDGTESIGQWKEYNFYVATEKKVTPSIGLTVGLGYIGKDNYIKGRLFVDNFSVVEVTEETFIARQPIEGENPEKLDQSSLAADKIPNNFRVVFTEEDANAEEGKEPDAEPEKANLNWLYITSGVVGGVIVVVVAIVLIKKFAPKRKQRLTKSSANKKPEKKTDNRDQFSK